MFTVHTLAELAELVRTGAAPYLRYSPGPESDAEHPSTDHESGIVMPGVSVNPLEAPRWWARRWRIGSPAACVSTYANSTKVPGRGY